MTFAFSSRVGLRVAFHSGVHNSLGSYARGFLQG